MRLLFLIAVLLGAAAVTAGQTDRIPSQDIRMSALRITKEHGICELRGKVRIETSSFVLTADQATFDPNRMTLPRTEP